MRHIVFLSLLSAFLALPVAADNISWVNDGGDGWDATEDVAAADMNEIKTSVDDNYTSIVAIDATEDGVADTAAALAANGANCAAGEYPLGVSAAGAAETCTDATTEINTVVATKSAATSTDNAVCRFDSTAGDVQDSGVTVDDTNNLDVPGDVTIGAGGGAACLILRDSDDTGDSACEVLNGTFTCETDTNGICGDAT